MNRLCLAPGGERFITVLRQHAPTWLIQLPSLVEEADREALQRQVQGTTQERMLREMAEALTVLTVEHGLIIVLEDLHWSDVSTLELLAYLARRQEPARLCIIGTYRLAEVQIHTHPLRGILQELRARSQCQELPIAPLSEAAIDAYVTHRLGRVPISETLTAMLHRRTEGNPLFMVATVEYLTRQGLLVEEAGRWSFKDASEDAAQWVPEDLRQLIEKQIDSLPADTQRLLEVASVVGVEFSVASVAAGVALEVEDIEERCSQLVRQGHFLQERGFEEWPDGTLGGCYRFLHALYQNVLYDRLAGAARARLHRQIGTCKETAYGERAQDIAAELAVHFEQGREYAQALLFYKQAGENALRRHAPHAASEHFTKALSLLELLPATPDRIEQELTLLTTLAVPVLVTTGHVSSELQHLYSRARALCQQVGQVPPQLFSVLYGLTRLSAMQGQYQTGREVAEQLHQLAQGTQDPTLLLGAHMAYGAMLLFGGELVGARKQFVQGAELCDPQQVPELLMRYGDDPGAVCRGYGSWSLWLLGYPDQALGMSHDSIAAAEVLAHPVSLTAARLAAAVLSHLNRDPRAVRKQTEALLTGINEQEFPLYAIIGTIIRGWTIAQQGRGEEGIRLTRQGLEEYQAAGAELYRSFFLALLTEACEAMGQAGEGLTILAEALEFSTMRGERWYDAELYRLQGELLLQQFKSTNPQSPNPYAEAEACFQQALKIAQQQQAKSWELRAALSLGRLWQEQGKPDDARQLLEEVYSWFTEGFETTDLQDAEVLLRSLDSQIERSTPAESSPQSAAAPPTEKSSPLLDPRPTSQPQAPVVSSPEPAISAATDASATEIPTSEAIFRQEGEYWTVAFEGQVSRVRHIRGMHYVAQLLSHPNEEFHVLALAGEGQPQNIAAGAQQSAAVENEAFQQGFTDAGEVLDPEARAAYRQRMQELQAELEEAHEFNDLGRIERLQEELDFLSQELTLAVGLGGRTRKTNSPTERARSTITKAIKSAIKQLAKSHPALGEYLTKTIRTGTFCRYTPDPRVPLTWQV